VRLTTSGATVGVAVGGIGVAVGGTGVFVGGGGTGVLVGGGGGWGVLVGGGPDPQQFVQAGLLTRLHESTYDSYPQKRQHS